MEEITLPSGAVLKISLASFKEGKALYQAVLEEMRVLKLDDNAEIDANFWKDVFCMGFSSRKIESSLKVCMDRCLYEGLKMDDATFEPAERRQDYMMVEYEVARANILPFVKSLYAKFSHLLENKGPSPA